MQRLPIQQFHREVMLTFFCRAGFIDRCNSRVLQVPEDFCFIAKTSCHFCQSLPPALKQARVL